MKPFRVGLQAWLGAATVAVGLIASLVVLLVVLPTLESSLRNDRALRISQQVERRLVQAQEEFRTVQDPAEFDQLLRSLAGELGGHAHGELAQIESDSDRVKKIVIDKKSSDKNSCTTDDGKKIIVKKKSGRQ